MYDLVIKNANIADGSKKPIFTADLGIKDGKIAAINADIGDTAKKTIQAAGLVAAPGFIDNHSHSDLAMLGKYRFDNIVEQGITTEITGQCGMGTAPMTYEDLEKFAGMFGVNARNLCSFSKQAETFSGYVKHLETLELGNNMASHVAHGTIRQHVMGFDNRAPGARELDQMKDHVRDAMEAGALGVSSGLIYPPGSYAEPRELVALLKVAAQYGGHYVTHIRNEGDTVVESVTEALEIGEQAGVAVTISHFKVMGKNNWHKMDKLYELIETARDKGMKVRADMYPYRAGCTGLISAIPNKFAAQGHEKLIENLKTRNFREQVKKELLTGKGFENFVDQCGFEGIMILTAAVTRELVGQNIADIARDRAADPFDVLFDIIVENNCGVLAGYISRCPEELIQSFSKPYMMGGTDGAIDSDVLSLAHPRYSGTFPRFIKRYVRERKLVSIEEAVHKLSYLPADMAGLKTKGLIRQGYDADLAIFDLDRLTDHADYINPAGKNEGMKYVIVNGEVAVQDDRFTGIHAGRFIKKA